MGISRDTLDRIRNALNPLDIIREAVPTLKQSGARWRGNCPFHNERTPSFFFMPEKGVWHCFGACNEGGDVFKFVMKWENLSFMEAVVQLGQRAGVPVEVERNANQSREAQERDRLIELLAKAATFYQDALLQSGEGEAARQHLAKRRIKPETVEKFRLGYAPQQKPYFEAALTAGAPIEDLTKAGLAAKSDRSGRFFDPLAQRLVFPIFDAYGRVVAFGGRTLAEDDDRGPKYLNSPETPVYTKGRHLYGLYQGRAALRERGVALVVEGYMDVVGCHQAGAAYAVAPLGTAFTKEQAGLLKRYTQEVVLLFDPDAAGEKASWRSAEVLLQNDLFVRVGRVPGGKDPDELVLEKGPGALEETVQRAQDVVDFMLDRLAERPGTRTGLNDRVQQAQELVRFLRGVPNEMLRREWTKRISRRLSLDESSLVRELEKGGASSGGRPAAPEKAPPARMVLRVPNHEEEIIQILCNHPEVWPGVTISEELFLDLRCRQLFHRLQQEWHDKGALDVASLASDLTPDDASWLTGLLTEEKTYDEPHENIAQRLRRLEWMAFERERKTLQGEVLQMLEGRLPRDEAKVERYQELTRALKAARPPAGSAAGG
jgi:DNA primase